MSNVLVFLLGLLLGNRLTLALDKRKEFNAAVLPIRAWLLSEIESPGGRRPSDLEFDIFVGCLPFWRRRGFCRAVERHSDECKKQRRPDGHGGWYIVADAPIRSAAEACMRYVDWR